MSSIFAHLIKRFQCIIELIFITGFILIFVWINMVDVVFGHNNKLQLSQHFVIYISFIKA